MTTAVDYAYRYPFESALLDVQSIPAIRLPTSFDEIDQLSFEAADVDNGNVVDEAFGAGEDGDDLFFDGTLRQPAVVGNALSILSICVDTLLPAAPSSSHMPNRPL